MRPVGPLGGAGRGSDELFVGFEEIWTAVDGRQIRSFSTGQRTGLPEVVMLPGMGATAALHRWARHVGRWTRASVLDLPGWGNGRGQASSSTVTGVAAAAARWLEVTDARGVVLAGHSSGSQSALHVARLVPDRLAGLVLSAPTLDLPARHPPVLAIRLLQAVVQEKPAELPTALPWFRSGALAWFRLLGSVMRDRPEHLLPTLGPPVLLLTGERDRFAPPAWAEHLATLAEAPLVVLPGPHNACFTSPQAAAAALHQAVLGWVPPAGRPPPYRSKTQAGDLTDG